MPQLLEDVVCKNGNKCDKCYGDRSVANCKHIFNKFGMVFYVGEFDMVSGEFDMVSGTNQDDQV